MKIYLAGKMTGVKDFNFPAFHAAAKMLRSEGHEVFNPAERDEAIHGKDFFIGDGDADDTAARGFSKREALAADTNYICMHADAIAMLPGWEHGRGSLAEWYLAVSLGLKIFYL